MSHNRHLLRIGHSPDPDDAFMWYPLVEVDGGPKIDTGPYRFEHVLEDIESLNRRAERAELEITALSIHQYAYVADVYALTNCGASMGDGYGPVLVAPEGSDLRLNDFIEKIDLEDIRLAVPGDRTTAFLVLSLCVGRRVLNYHVVPFDQIISRVAKGEFDAGLIIHEGQLTYAGAGLKCVVDLGWWWKRKYRLPLPLGGNAIRRDLARHYDEICTILYNSIRYAMDHRRQAVKYAMNYARDMGQDLADKFVGMYVNKWTLDYGALGRLAVQKLLDEAAKAKLVPPVGPIDYVRPTT